MAAFLKSRRLHCALLGLVAIACGAEYLPEPPPLNQLPERHETVPAEVIHDLAWPAEANLNTASMQWALEDLVRGIGRVDSAEALNSLLERIEPLREENRVANYQSWVANLLTEMGEWLSLPGAELDAEAAQKYFAWRLKTGQMTSGSITWMVNNPDYRQPTEVDVKATTLLVDSLSELPIGNAALTPFILTQRATSLFYTGAMSAAEWNYKKVIEGYPNHPRAEAAQLMLGRVHMELGRDSIARADGVAGEPYLSRAVEAFENYLETYPEGRFVPSAHGWLGGIATLQGRYADALPSFLWQLEMQPTPEIGRSVLRDCDAILERLLAWDYIDQSLEDLPYDALARNPEVALLLASHVMDPITASAYIRYYGSGAARQPQANVDNLNILQDRLAIREQGGEILARLAAASSQLDGQSRRPEMLTAILAHAAFAKRDYVSVLALSGDQDLIANPSLFQLRALALHRLGRHEGVLEMGEEGELALLPPGVQEEYFFLKARALEEMKRRGEAVVAYLRPRKVPHEEGYEGGAFTTEMQERAKVLLALAPLSELIEGYSMALSLEEEDRKVLRRHLLRRALAESQFEIARTLLPGEDDADIERSDNNDVSPREWRAHIEPVITMSSAPGRAGDAGARHALALGDLYNQLGKHLRFGVLEDEALQILDNAITMGYALPEAQMTLDLGSPTFHALKLYLYGFEKAVDEELKFKLAVSANDALYRLSQESVYHAYRASQFEGMAPVRRWMASLEGRGLRDFVNYDYSIYSDKEDDLRFASMPGWQADIGLGLRWKKEILEDVSWQIPRTTTRTINSLLSRAASEPEVNLSELAAQLEGQVSIGWALPMDYSLSETLNVAEDRLVAMKALDYDLAQYRQYLDELEQMMRGIPIEVAKTILPDFIEYRRIAELPPRSEARIAALEAFLAAYPDSLKREAAMTRLARDLVLSHHPMPETRRRAKVAQPRLHRLPGVRMQRVPEVVPEAAAAVESYLTAYPAGRYLRDILYLKAHLATAAGKTSEAFELLDQLMTEERSSLDIDLGKLLAVSAQDLLDRDRRAATIKAFAEYPSMIDRLERLARPRFYLAQLRPFITHLRMQVE